MLYEIKFGRASLVSYWKLLKTSMALTFVTVDFWPFASSFNSVGVFMFHFMMQ